MRQVASAALLCGALLVPMPSQAQERPSVSQFARTVATEFAHTRDAPHQEVQIRLFGALEGVVGGRRADMPQTTWLKRCTSTKKGMWIGAAIGAVGGALLGAHVDRSVRGTASGRVVLLFAAGGAGLGAATGHAVCR